MAIDLEKDRFWDILDIWNNEALQYTHDITPRQMPAGQMNEVEKYRPDTDYEGGSEVATSLNSTIMNEDLEALLMPGVYDDAAQHAHVVSDPMPCQSLLLRQQHTETLLADSSARLRDMPENAEGITGECTGLSHARDASPTHDKEAQPGWHMANGFVTSKQTSQSEHDLNEESLDKHVDEEFSPAVLGRGFGEKAEGALRHDNLLRKKEPVVYDLPTVAIQQQKPEDGEVVVEGTGQECATTPNAVILNDGKGCKQPVNDVHKERPTRNGETEDAAGLSSGVSKESVEDEERCLGLLRGGLLGSKENPVVLDDDESDDGEPKRRPSHHSIGSVSDDGGSNGVDGSSVRPTRRKRQREFDGFEQWGSAKFRRQRLAECQTHWVQVRAHWVDVQATLPKLHEQDPCLVLSIAQFYTGFYRLWAALEVNASFGASIRVAEVLEAISLWQKFNKALETGGAAISKGEREAAAKFEQAMDALRDAVALCDNITQYPSFVEKKDEQRDRDYKPRQKKIRRQL
ncbi:hypothetical protein A1F96_10724 [Pyrenophora tritici-repentis]|nr:hypothetical protein A1F96_10724 [Pyrenophora tritici-repentis]